MEIAIMFAGILVAVALGKGSLFAFLFTFATLQLVGALVWMRLTTIRGRRRQFQMQQPASYGLSTGITATESMLGA